MIKNTLICIAGFIAEKSEKIFAKIKTLNISH